MTEYTGIENLEVMLEARQYNAFLRSVIDTRLKLQDKVVDFGAGAGTFAIPLVSRGVDIVCVEQDARLRKILQEANATTVASIDEIEPGSVDVIYSFNVLEHIKDDRQALCALAGKLKHHGRLILYVPAFPIHRAAVTWNEAVTEPQRVAPASSQTQHEFPCKQCGANLQFQPGTRTLKCPYCGAVFVLKD